MSDLLIFFGGMFTGFVFVLFLITYLAVKDDRRGRNG